MPAEPEASLLKRIQTYFFTSHVVTRNLGSCNWSFKAYVVSDCTNPLPVSHKSSQLEGNYLMHIFRKLDRVVTAYWERSLAGIPFKLCIRVLKIKIPLRTICRFCIGKKMSEAEGFVGFSTCQFSCQFTTTWGQSLSYVHLHKVKIWLIFLLFGSGLEKRLQSCLSKTNGHNLINN